MAEEQDNIIEPAATAAPAEAPAPVAQPEAAAAPAAPATAPAATAAPAATENERQKTINDVVLSLDGGATEAPKVIKAKGSKNVSSGIVHVTATFNNTLVSVTDRNGNVIGWS